MTEDHIKLSIMYEVLRIRSTYLPSAQLELDIRELKKQKNKIPSWSGLEEISLYAAVDKFLKKLHANAGQKL